MSPPILRRSDVAADIGMVPDTAHILLHLATAATLIFLLMK